MTSPTQILDNIRDVFAPVTSGRFYKRTSILWMPILGCHRITKRRKSDGRKLPKQRIIKTRLTCGNKPQKLVTNRNF